MLTRRSFAALAAAGLAAAPSWGAARARKVVLYANVGRELAWHDLDVEEGSVSRRGSVQLPSNLQYAWPAPSRRFLYAVSSSGFPGFAGENHLLTAWRIDPRTGALQPHGEAAALPYRPIHVSLDGEGRFAMISYIEPSHLSIHRIRPDGTVGAPVEQPVPPDTGIYAHQLRTTPANATALLVTRGYDASANMPERPGALKVFGFKDGVLTRMSSVAPGGGYGFGPRHLDFHPTLPLVYVSLERQNKLYVFRLQPDGGLAPEPVFVTDTLADSPGASPGQQAGTIHVHPNGRFVYQANRNSRTLPGSKLQFAGGANDIAVFAIDPISGEPKLIQNAPVNGIQPRTFAIDPSGTLLVAASIQPLIVASGDMGTFLSAGLSVFRIGEDGRLTILRKYDVATANGTLFWSGIVAL